MTDHTELLLHLSNWAAGIDRALQKFEPKTTIETKARINISHAKRYLLKAAKGLQSDQIRQSEEKEQISGLQGMDRLSTVRGVYGAEFAADDAD